MSEVNEIPIDLAGGIMKCSPYPQQFQVSSICYCIWPVGVFSKTRQHWTNEVRLCVSRDRVICDEGAK